MAKRKQNRSSKKTNRTEKVELQPSLTKETSSSGAGLPMMQWVTTIAGFVSLLCVVLAFSSLTRSVDDVKVPIYFMAGACLMPLAIATLLQRNRALEPAWIHIGLWSYYGVVILSTILSDYSWAGIYQIQFLWAGIGFFLAFYCAGTDRKTSEVAIRFLVIQLMITNLIGVLLYDFSDHPEVRSIIGRIYLALDANHFFASGSRTAALLRTFAGAESNMQSTILNRDFYAGFCCLYLPMAVVMAIDPGQSRYKRLWQAIAIPTVLMSITCIVACQSKGEYFVLVVELILIAIAIYHVEGLNFFKRIKVLPWLIGIAMFFFVFLWMKSPLLITKLKSLGGSIDSRSVIWGGSVEIFKNFPFLGGGPGSFVIYFPEFRRPDYFLGEISNVTLYSHNYYLDLLCETGVLGFSTFMMMWCGIMLLGLKVLWNHPERRMQVLLAGTLVGLLAFSAANASSPNGRWVIGGSSFWAVMGLATGLLHQARLRRAASKSESITTENIAAAPLPVFQKAPLWCGLLVCVVMLPTNFQTGSSYFSAAQDYVSGYTNSMYVQTTPSLSVEQQMQVLQMAENSFKQTLETYPDNLSAYYHLGSVYSMMSRVMQNQAYELNMQPDARNSEETQKKIQTFSQAAASYLKLSIKAYEELEDKAPDYAEIHYNLGLVYNQWGNYLASQGEEQKDLADSYQKKALEHLDRMGKLSVKDQIALQRGQQYFQMGDKDKAVAVLREAAERYPDNEQVAQAYQQAAMMSDNKEAQGEALLLQLKQNPANERILRQLILWARREKQDAILTQALEHLEKINPVHPMLFENRVNLAERSGDWQKVMEQAELYKKVNGPQNSVYYKAATAAEKLEEFGQARELYEFILSKDPDAKTVEGKRSTQRLEQLP